MAQNQEVEGSPGVTDWLHRWSAGDEDARAVVFESVYRDLRRAAGRFFRRERLNHTLQPTAVVNEALIRLFDCRGVQWTDRAQFFGFASRVMRQVLVDYSREKGAAKRGGGLRQQSLPDALESKALDAVEILALDRALGTLEGLDPDQARIVEARFFVGLSVDECAEYLGVSSRTVKRQWRRARAWLHAELGASHGT